MPAAAHDPGPIAFSSREGFSGEKILKTSLRGTGSRELEGPHPDFGSPGKGT